MSNEFPARIVENNDKFSYNYFKQVQNNKNT